MTRIKFCGLSRKVDILAANELLPDYIGFVLWPQSRRYVSPERAEELRKMLDPGILTVGVFVDEKPEVIASLAEAGIVDIVQLHGHEDDDYINILRGLTSKEIIKVFHGGDIISAQDSTADYVLLDSGMGTGRVFDWSAITIMRPYFLAGGLTPDNVRLAIDTLMPFAVDVSSGIETEGIKDKAKMTAFIEAVRKETL